MKSMRYAASFLCAVALAGCATKPSAQSEPPITLPARVVDNSCTIWKPIFFAKTDVVADTTAEEVIGHNCRGVIKCGWKIPGLDCSKLK